MTKVAILCSDGPHHRYLVAALAARFEVVAVVVEPAARQRRRLLCRKRYIDYVYSVYHLARRTVFGLDAYRRGYFAALAVDPVSTSRSLPTTVVDWVNEPAVADLLTRADPDVTIVMGTSILSKSVLRAAGDVILNVHGGYLPDFRGNHCFFFALYEDAFDRVGSTIHFVDPGIDTGDIVEVVVPPMYRTDTAETLYCRAEKLAIQHLLAWLERYERGEPLPRHPQASRGRLYRTRDRQPYHDIIFWLRRRTGRLVLPEGPNATREAGSSTYGMRAR